MLELGVGVGEPATLSDFVWEDDVVSKNQASNLLVLENHPASQEGLEPPLVDTAARNLGKQLFELGRRRGIRGPTSSMRLSHRTPPYGLELSRIVRDYGRLRN